MQRKGLGELLLKTDSETQSCHTVSLQVLIMHRDMLQAKSKAVRAA